MQSDTNAVPSSTEFPASVTGGKAEPGISVGASDPAASVMAFVWVVIHEKLGDLSQENSAHVCKLALEMEQWAHEHGQDLGRTFAAWAEFLREAYAELSRQEPPSGVKH